MAFDTATRNKLARMVAGARSLLSREFTEQLQGIYGIQPDGTLIEMEKLTHLDDEERAIAAMLRDRVNHLANNMAAEKKPLVAAIDRMTREQAFTLLNRFAALRMCEERKLIQESIGSGLQSKGFKVYLQIAGSGLGDTYARYKTYLLCLFDEIAIDLGVIFDRYSSLGLLFPREAALLALLELLDDKELQPLWAEDETIGWIYQYFNSQEEREKMRKASRSPRNSRELAVRNQFFTPRYVVEFLTDNTLGRLWYEMTQGETTLKDECRYLVRRPDEIFLSEGEDAPEEEQTTEDLSQEELLQQPVYIPFRKLKDPRQIRMLDPACGSMHFGLYAFDLYERIYEEAWEIEAQYGAVHFEREDELQPLHECFGNKDDFLANIPRLIIEHNIHGVDIDPRAVQIAGLSLWLRAQRNWQQKGIKQDARPTITRSNIVCAEPMPGDKDMLAEFTENLEPRVLGQLVEIVFDKMQLAGEAGSLLKIEEEIADAVEGAREVFNKEMQAKKDGVGYLPGMAPQKRQTSLFDFTDLTDKTEFWERAEEMIIHALQGYAGHTQDGSINQRRLFVKDAARGFAFIDLCRKRYDAVLMNPPFGASSLVSKKYIESRYHKTKGDVLANFIERALILIYKQGRVGAISNRTPFFLSSFETLRTEVLGKEGHVRLLADLGEGVLEAMVETAIYVITKERDGEPESLFFRLLVNPEKGKLLHQLTEKYLQSSVSDQTFAINPKHFAALSGRPYTYWVTRAAIANLGAYPCIEGTKGAIRVGLQTGEDFRHLRLLWEISRNSIVPRFLNKVNPSQTIRQQCIYQSKNLGSWIPFSKTEVASPWFSPITLAVNWANDGKELKNFTNSKGKLRSRPQNEKFYFNPGFSYMGRSTRLVPYLVPAGVMPTARRAQIFPKQGEEYSVLGICASNVGSAVARFSGEKFAWPNFQAGMVQGLPACDFPKETLKLIKKYVDTEVNKRRAVVQRYEPFQEFTLPAWLQMTEDGETIWDLYSLFGRGLENKIAEAFGLSPEQLVELERDIREAVAIRERSKDADEDAGESEQELNVELISETPEEKAIGLFMYALGVALSRWDLRFALDPSLAPKLPEPFDPLPVCPPGMLVGTDGLPADSGSIVSEEWLCTRLDANTLPPEGSVQKATIPDSEYPLRITWSGILVDDPGIDGTQPHHEDIVRRIREVFDVLWEDKAHEIEQEACKILRVKGFYEYFHKPTKFFQDHLKRYSKSRRKAPIYWPLSTDSGSYTLWIYYHRLTDQTLFTCVTEFLDPKIKDVSADIAALRGQVSQESSTENRQKLEKLLDLESELIDFREELLRIANLPYKPNLNDGVMITAAPLWKLFRHRQWSKDLQKCWQKLENGDYDWAHLAYSIWPERVIPQCHKDHSLAIAHDLEEELWEEIENGTDRQGNPKYKWEPKKLSREDIQLLIKEKTGK